MTVTVFGEELAQLGAHDGAGLAEERVAEFEQLGGDLVGGMPNWAGGSG